MHALDSSKSNRHSISGDEHKQIRKDMLKVNGLCVYSQYFWVSEDNLLILKLNYHG